MDIGYDTAIGNIADTHSSQSFLRLKWTRFPPRRPALAVQPGSWLRSKRHDWGVAFGLTAPSAVATRRWSWIQIQPFDNAALECLSLGVLAR
jgi:hypothetical protein